MCPWQQSSVLCCVPGNLEDLALTETPRGPPGAGRGFPGGRASPLAVGLGPCRLCRGPRAPGHTAAAQRAAQRAAALPAALKPGLAWGHGPRPGRRFPRVPESPALGLRVSCLEWCGPFSRHPAPSSSDSPSAG